MSAAIVVEFTEEIHVGEISYDVDDTNNGLLNVVVHFLHHETIVRARVQALRDECVAHHMAIVACISCVENRCSPIVPTCVGVSQHILVVEVEGAVPSEAAHQQDID